MKRIFDIRPKKTILDILIFLLLGLLCVMGKDLKSKNLKAKNSSFHDTVKLTRNYNQYMYL